MSNTSAFAKQKLLETIQSKQNAQNAGILGEALKDASEVDTSVVLCIGCNLIKSIRDTVLTRAMTTFRCHTSLDGELIQIPLILGCMYMFTCVIYYLEESNHVQRGVYEITSTHINIANSIIILLLPYNTVVTNSVHIKPTG